MHVDIIKTTCWRDFERGVFDTQLCQKSSPRKRKYPVRGGSLRENALLKPEVRGNWANNSHGLTKIRKVWWVSISAATFGWLGQNLASIHLALYQQFRWWWYNDVGDGFLAHFGPTEHHLNSTAWLSVAADHVHPCMSTVSPSSDGWL